MQVNTVAFWTICDKSLMTSVYHSLYIGKHMLWFESLLHIYSSHLLLSLV